MTSERAAPATAVVVLGAGRSGTSALTRGLSALGVDLGDKLRGPGGKNPTGFFEDQDILALNKRLKRQLGIRGHSLGLIDAAAWDRAGVRALQGEAVTLLRRRFGPARLWGFKYARTLRMLPFWERVLAELGLDVRYVVALRNPLSVARSRAKLHPERGRQQWSDLEWLVNVVPYFDYVLARRFTVVDFDRLLADPAAQLQRIAAQLDLALADDQQRAIQAYARAFVQPGMRHSRFTRDDLARDVRVNRWTAEAFAVLDGLAADERRADDPQLRPQWRALQAGVAELAPLLDEFDHLRARLDRTRWNPISPIQPIRQAWRDLRSR